MPPTIAIATLPEGTRRAWRAAGQGRGEWRAIRGEARLLSFRLHTPRRALSPPFVSCHLADATLRC